MKGTRRWIVLGIGAALLAAAGWYLGSPLVIDRRVDEAFPPAEPTRAMETAMAATPKAMDDAMPEESAATLLATGAFYPIAHEGRGRAGVYEFADGSRLLRFEDFEVLNGPDLHVWLVPVDPVPDTVGVEIDGYLDLGPLKGNLGDQNYSLPAGLDLAAFRSVVVWCQPFRVPFAAAPLVAP